MPEEPQIPKEELYFSGMPLNQDPSKPLPGEIRPTTHRRFVRTGKIIVLVGAGVVLGALFAPETPNDMQKRLAVLEEELKDKQQQIEELERSITYKTDDVGGKFENNNSTGALKLADRLRHMRQGRRYAATLRKLQAQPAAELIEWFIPRWNLILDHPKPDDRTTRLAETLSLLIGGMAKNLHPGDYVPWQAEFLSGDWLGELHFDINGDGLPGKRTDMNPRDGFSNVSVCHIAMALNLSVRDAQVLVMPKMRCDSPRAKVSVFLQGRTLDDALTEFVTAMRQEGFLVVERQEKGIRLILVGPGTRGG